jgi:serine/threonine protein kinase
LIGKTLGKFQIIEQIGRGGMASVYKAYQPGLDRYVAIKTMHAFLAEEEGFVERFRREAQSVARLRHPNIVQMYDFDVEHGTYYMVMEFLEGPSLKNKLAQLEKRGEWMTLEESIHIIRDVGEALQYAHSRGMSHRDIKPANIMLKEDGGAILTDFGIVKMLSGTTHLTATGALIGTPAYMAPEQGTGSEGDIRADIYSLGIVLYQLTTGRLPYNADTPMAIVLQHLTAPLPIPRTLNPDLPEGIQRVILKSLAKDPEDRYQSVQEMLDQLDRAIKGQVIAPVDPAITAASQPMAGEPTLKGSELVGSQAAAAEGARPMPPSRKWPPWWVFGLVGLALFGVVGVGLALMASRNGGSAPASQVPTQRATASPSATLASSSTPQPSATPDVAGTARAATVDAFFLTRDAPTATPLPTSTPTKTAPPTETPRPTATKTATATRTATLTAVPSNTPDLTATAYAACVFDATLEQHITVRNGQYFQTGVGFEKIWRVSNVGTCPWPMGTQLAFVDGNQMGAEESIDVELAAAGDSVDIVVGLRAPNQNGYYEGKWQLQLPGGKPFGEQLVVQINVGPTPTPRATSTPQPTPTPPATATPAGPVEMSVPSILGGTCWANSNEGRWGGTLVWSAWGGTGEYEFYIGAVSPEFKLEGPSYEFSSQVRHNWPVQTFIVVSGGQTYQVYRGVEERECFP